MEVQCSSNACLELDTLPGTRCNCASFSSHCPPEFFSSSILTQCEHLGVDPGIVARWFIGELVRIVVVPWPQNDAGISHVDVCAAPTGAIAPPRDVPALTALPTNAKK